MDTDTKETSENNGNKTPNNTSENNGNKIKLLPEEVKNSDKKLNRYKKRADNLAVATAVMALILAGGVAYHFVAPPIINILKNKQANTLDITEEKLYDIKSTLECISKKGTELNLFGFSTETNSDGTTYIYFIGEENNKNVVYRVTTDTENVPSGTTTFGVKYSDNSITDKSNNYSNNEPNDLSSFNFIDELENCMIEKANINFKINKNDSNVTFESSSETCYDVDGDTLKSWETEENSPIGLDKVQSPLKKIVQFIKLNFQDINYNDFEICSYSSSSQDGKNFVEVIGKFTIGAASDTGSDTETYVSISYPVSENVAKYFNYETIIKTDINGNIKGIEQNDSKIDAEDKENYTKTSLNLLYKITKIMSPANCKIITIDPAIEYTTIREASGSKEKKEIDKSTTQNNTQNTGSDTDSSKADTSKPKQEEQSLS